MHGDCRVKSWSKVVSNRWTTFNTEVLLPANHIYCSRRFETRAFSQIYNFGRCIAGNTCTKQHGDKWMYTADRAASICFGLQYVHWPHQCSADTGTDTWKKQALYHMPGWLTFAEQVQTLCRAKGLKSTCKQVMSLARRLKRVAIPVKSARINKGEQTECS